ncbi:hypothetical protein HY439_00075 [Candidatus Microgenomates bacterium]|nr:hypothetical protein [Candidatus Microgenomates bacterium]
MKKTIYFLLVVLILALLESTIIPLRLVILAVLIWVIIRLPKEGFAGAFLAGIILDLTRPENPLGLSSVIFLLIAFLLNLYKGKFKITRFIYLFPIAFFGLFIWQIFEKNFSFSTNLFINAFIIFLFRPLITLWSRRNEGTSLQMPLKI